MLYVKETVSQMVTRDVVDDNGRVIISHCEIFGSKHPDVVTEITTETFGPFDTHKDAAKFAENPVGSDRKRYRV